MRYSQDHEFTSQSEHSPGPVKDSEELLRVISCPEHIKDGCVLATAVSLTDLRERGFSVDRLGHAIRTVIEQRISRQMANEREERQESTISKFRCGAVRELLNEGCGRACIVIDTALVGVREEWKSVTIHAFDPANSPAPPRLRASARGPLSDRTINRLARPMKQLPVANPRWIPMVPNAPAGHCKLGYHAVLTSSCECSIYCDAHARKIYMASLQPTLRLHEHLPSLR